MEFLDLSRYEYSDFPLEMRAVGWLGREHGLQSGDPHADSRLILKELKASSVREASLTLGFHDCAFCPPGARVRGNGEFRYHTLSGNSYAAPVMILHYVEAHGYVPSQVFIEELRAGRELPWDHRAQRLMEVLFDENAELGMRCQAIVDLPRWRDPRALNALKWAMRHEDLADVASDQIGISLGEMILSGLDVGVDSEDLGYGVNYGIAQVIPGWKWAGDA
ncbi:hypothetical protein Cs7R123_62730 [Catellatospora sp. TT07R-123]|uniref:DUF7919 family protein n=1 Tax=Catellatospora sp. TT07R-123 TaxID=2733863 RepID=UPI001AFEE7CA|nr:hypothetical protein [Catellatospora sp. TT07R-123]GHJ48931.1 hypothetical protein Cs7R123_62730 [Catellatospora sp. TT07R-123]